MIVDRQNNNQPDLKEATGYEVVKKFVHLIANEPRWLQ